MTATSMMDQYHSLKASVPDAILLFRMGDFYEMFHDDAVIAAPILDIALTARNKHDPEPIPMAGVPHHSVANYIERLTEAGHRVAIAEQVGEVPKKGLVERRIVRVVTPGVTYDPRALPAQQRTWLVAVARHEQAYGVAFLEVSTGDLRVAELSQDAHVLAEVERLEPREALFGPGVPSSVVRAVSRQVRLVSEVDAEAWEPQAATDELAATVGVVPVDLGTVARVCAGAVLRYAREQLGGDLSNVHGVEAYTPHAFMVIDEATRRNLELARTLIGQRRRGSLLDLIDKTQTPMGARTLGDWVASPLLATTDIEARQGCVAALVTEAPARRDLRAALSEIVDIPRIGARISQATAHARDLAALLRSLQAAPKVLQAIAGLAVLDSHRPTDLVDDVTQDLATWLVDDPPQSMTEGGMIRPEADPELAELHRLALDGVSIIAKLEAEEQEKTGIPSLKIKRNRVFGYFLEVTSAHLHKVPDRFLRKQTLSNCERYITPELKELEEKVLGADERRRALEYERFVELRQRVSAESARLLTLARALAGLDALASLAEVAAMRRWVQPTVDASQQLDIRAGRHPMVEAALDEERFVPNDVRLDPEHRSLIVLTGPNMSGKSTVLRQTAIIAVLAQMGSFVPADGAHIGVCDRVFTRVGAADDLRRGQSTFMVEMSETASILQHATDRSLVVLDEIGRGTSTYDGLAIAWAVAEDLVDRVQCRALFATHYHELCELAEVRGTVANQSVAVTEVDGQILFLRRLKAGGASRSYGIQCARIAGLPGPVIDRANALLSQFEERQPLAERRQLTLFAAGGPPPTSESAVPEVAKPEPDPVRDRLAGVDPDDLSPRQAMELVYELRGLLSGKVS
ncbi:MAG: DNA mismatch repair protein MutS [Myxococcota bacterium]